MTDKFACDTSVIFNGEILLLISMFLIPWIFALPFYGLELLVGFVQALIFGGLTLVFFTVAVAPHGAEA